MPGPVQPPARTHQQRGHDCKGEGTPVEEATHRDDRHQLGDRARERSGTRHQRSHTDDHSDDQRGDGGGGDRDRRRRPEWTGGLRDRPADEQDGPQRDKWGNRDGDEAEARVQVEVRD